MTGSSEDISATNLNANAKRVWLFALVLSLATALLIISPFFWMGNASGHDFSFHVASWVDAATQWRDGILLPRWADGANHGFGEPRFIFYPPISWMFGAALGLVVPWIFVPAVFIVLTQTLAGMCAFALGRRLFPQRGALVCAVCYAANPYALLIVYMRSDFAEQLALAFFPILFLAAAEVADLLASSAPSLRRSIVFLAITFAAVWLTNAPAAVVASYSLAMLFAWTALTQKSWRPLLHGGAALALGFGAASFYLVPAAYEQSWVNISLALASGLQPSQNVLYTVIADPEHNAFNRIASNTAVLMVVLTGVFAALSFPRGRSITGLLAKSFWSALLAVSVMAAFLMTRISNILWVVLPKLRFVQFPWRWMSILAIPFACFISAAIVHKQMRGYRAPLTIAALLAVLGCTATYMVRHTWWDSEDVPVLLEALQNEEGFEGVDEYDPLGDDHALLPEKSERVAVVPATPEAETTAESDAEVTVQRWTAERKEMRITAREPLILRLRLLDYPAWRVEVNEVVVVPEKTGEIAQITVPLNAGSSHVVVRFIRTPDRTIGAVISGASVLIALLLFTRRPAVRAPVN
ncbi:MAG TPA: 6-pyruvoyl-tetrahydropterin synthase-related protein [Candidatus Dormibacteraeota bacterium]|nr:6-pyruvoyl-tetrahydropterin synthase-related protein [Candidatus Dormibacteraeota bacterium]